MDDSKIVDLYLARDESAIKETRKKYGANLRRISDNILNNKEDAEECEADTYLYAWNTIPQKETEGLPFCLSRSDHSTSFYRQNSKGSSRKAFGGVYRIDARDRGMHRR